MPTRRRFVIFACFGAALVSLLCFTFGPVPSRSAGPVRFIVGEAIGSGSQGTRPEAPQETQVLLHGRETQLPAATNLLVAQLSNSGPNAIQLVGYDSSTPIYAICVVRSNRLETFFPRPFPKLCASLRIDSGQSLSFPVLSPITDQRWFMTLSYFDYIPRRPPAGRTQTQQLADGIKAFLGFSEVHLGHFVTNEWLSARPAPSLPMQKSRANPASDYTNRTSSPPGSRR